MLLPRLGADRIEIDFDPFASIPEPVIDRKKIKPRRRPRFITPSNIGFAADVQKAPEDYKPKRKKVDHIPRARKFLEDLGMTVTRVDRWDDRLRIQIDYLGIFDLVGERPGMIWDVQVTSEANMPDRLRKMCSDKPAPDNRRPRIENLRRQLALGHIVVILGFGQPGGEGTHWKPIVQRITEPLIQKVVSRRRKPRK